MDQPAPHAAPRQIGTNLGPVEVRDEGTGPAVVLSHAALTNHTLWDGMAAALATDHRVIRATLPMGAHRIPAAHRSRITVPHLADALVEVLDTLGVEQATVVGVDSGGAVAQMVVARHPDRVAGLFLFSCDAFEHLPPTLFKPVCALMRLPGAAVLFEGYRLGLVRKWGGWRLVTKRGATPELVSSWFEPMRADRRIRDDLAALFASARGSVMTEVTDRLAAYPGPVHVAWSRDDFLFPARDAERLVATFPNAELSWIDDALAFAHLDQPAVSEALVRRFLTERVEQAAAG